MALAMVVGMLLLLISVIFLPFFHWAKNRRKVLMGLSIIFLLVIIYATFSFPYDSTHPKRVFIQHTLAYDPPLFVSEDFDSSRHSDSIFQWKDTLNNDEDLNSDTGGKWRNSLGKRVATRMVPAKELNRHITELPQEDIGFISMVDPYPISTFMKYLGTKGISLSILFF